MGLYYNVLRTELNPENLNPNPNIAYRIPEVSGLRSQSAWALMTRASLSDRDLRLGPRVTIRGSRSTSVKGLGFLA